MRLLTLLATTVLLAACVHDTDDFNLFVTDTGASLTYYIGNDEEGRQKAHDDPWDTIRVKFDTETTHTGKSNKDVGAGPDDPWDTILEKFDQETTHTGSVNKSGEPDDPWDTINDKFGRETTHTGSGNKSGDPDDPWNRINSLFPLESVHTGKTNNRYFLGFEKSVAVFVSFNYEVSFAGRARVVEVRGNILKLEFADGVVQYVIDAPATWTEGTQLVTGFLDATSKKDRPFLGVRFWRTVKGGSWGPVSGNIASEIPEAWPRENFASGASLLVGLPGGQKSHDDPWDTIGESFPIESIYTGAGKSHDDPWNTIRENFSVESVHTGKGKSHDDPWDTINENFSKETVHTGKAKIPSFAGEPIVKMLFVGIGGEKGEEDDPWNRISELFQVEENGGVALTLVEVRGEVGQFATADGRSLFAVQIPAGWEPGLVLRGEAYLLESKKMLPLMGAVVWAVDRNLSLPKAN